MSSLTKLTSSRSFEGYQNIYQHASTELHCVMNFGAYVPPQAEAEKLPVIFWLSGLTCTEKNFIEKAGAQKYAREHGLIIINPDTSPRNVNIEGEDESYDFGSGAGFYLDATEEKWKKNYRMYSYVTKELPALIAENFNADINRMGIMGHSMGGHGALICSLKNPGLYKSVSAFSPICNPINCKWGKKAFTGYLGDNIEAWKEYDSCELVKKYSGPPLQIWVDQGLADQFYTEKQLLPENLVDACASVGVPIVMRKHENYDHSYYFIATFLEDHIKHHMKFLKN